MKVLEHFACSKTGQEILNEDCTVMTEDFIAVVDGVTSKSCPKIDGKSGGRFAADVASAVIRHFAPDITAREAVNLLTRSLQEAVAGKIRLEGDVDHPALGCIVYSKARREVWRVADPGLMLDGILHLNEIAIDKVTSAARALVLEIALRKGASESGLLRDDKGREFIAPLHKDQHWFANRAGTYGYGVINGSFVPDEFIEIFDARGVREIVFASDGYPRLFSTLKESEDYLALVLKEDPLLFRKHLSTKGLQPGFVSFDDRTYIRFLTETV